MSEIWKAPFKIFGMTFFALVSFVTLCILFGLFFAGAGYGIGSAVGSRDLGDFGIEEEGYTFVAGKENSGNRLLTLQVEGPILGTPSFEMGLPVDWMGVTFGYQIRDELADAAKDSSVKGVLIHMQTPGGTIFGSMAIHSGIKAYQAATGKPVLVYIEGLSASGGVMAMSGADAIYADHGSMIGSIGVLGGMLTYFNEPTATQGGLFGGGIVTQGGIEHTVISAGRSKDLGNPFRRPTEEEISVLQDNIENEYDKFIAHVAANRNIDPVVIREKMGAQIFDNDTAVSYGLVDGTLDRNGALAKLAEMSGVGEDYQLVKPGKDRKQFFRELLFAIGKENGPTASVRKSVSADFCRVFTRGPLVYHGDVSRLCLRCQEGQNLF